jgi:hypothetical protein
MLVPKLFTALRGYDRRQAAADVSSGVIVGIVALPLAIAFATASGVTPDRGFAPASGFCPVSGTAENTKTVFNFFSRRLGRDGS